MKTSFKKITSIFLAALMLVSVMTVSGVMVSATDTDSIATGSGTVVLDASFCEEGGYAEWYAWTWSEGGEGHWVQASGGTSASDITYDGIEDWVVFARMNPEKQLPSWNTETDGDIVWNQTEDLYVEGGKYVIDSWGEGWGAKLTGHWEGDVGGDNYYLVGKINGVDVEGNDYQFYDGFLTMTIYEESYVAVKDGRGDWYMTHGFPGFDATSASLYKTYFGEEGTDKLYVPAGEVTFTLTDYGNGELYLSYSIYQEQTTSPIITDPPTTSPVITDPPTTAPITTAPVVTDPPVTTQPVSTIPTDATEADEDQNLYVSAKSNINLIGSKVKVIGNTVTVSYTLKTPEKIDDAQYFVTYDSTKLVLSTTYNTQSSMFPIAKDTTYNLGAGLSMAKFNFSGTDGAYDFTNGGVLVNLVFTRKSSTTVGTALVYLNIGDLNSKNTIFVNDGEIENSAGLEVGQNISSAPVVEPTDEVVVTDPNPNLTVNASSNISPEVQRIVVDKSNVKITYKMTVPEIIAYGKGVVTYDSAKLALETKYNTQSSMFTTLNTQTIYNLNAGTGTMMFSFTSVDPETQSGTYDFRAGGDVITLVFTVRQGATGSADVYLDLMDLGSFGKDYFEQGNATSSAGDITSNIVMESQQATTSDVSETTLPIATTTEDTKNTEESSSTAETTGATGSSETEAPTTASTAPTTKTPTTNPKPTTPKPTQPTTAKPATNLGPGANAAAVDSAIKMLKNDNDPKGSAFGLLKAKATKVTKNSIKVTWTKVKGAKKYIVYSNKCGKTNGKINAYKKIKETTAKSYKLTKIDGKKLTKGTYYKFLIVAVKSNGKVASTSKTIHVATSGGKVGNYKSVKLNKTKVTLKKGKTFKLKATCKVQSKKLKVKNHRKVKYESSNTKIATVTSSGKIKAKKKGTCYVYAYAQNGVYKKVKVTVKK